MSTIYELDCVDCSYRTVVTDEFATARDEVEGHRQAVDAGPAAHFVNVHRRADGL